MAIILNGIEIKPTPLMTISQQSEFRDSGEIKTTVRTVELKGKILAVDPVAGETEPSGDVFTVDKKKLGFLRNKIVILENLIKHNIDDIYISTSIQGPHLNEKFKLKSKNFQINESSLICDYTISLEQIIMDLQEPDETWSLDPADEYQRFVKINRTRNIQVKSTNNEGEDYYQLAIAKLKPIDSILDASTYLAVPMGNTYNKTTSYSVNIYKNSVECTESWIVSKDPCIIEQTTTIKESSDSIYKSASLQGTITGYESSSITKYDNAKTKFDLIKTWKIGDTYAIGSVSGKVKSISEGTNKIAGTINFSVDISEGIEEDGERTKSITWTDTPPLINFTVIAAIGKIEGPIIQKLTTKKNGVKTVNVEVLYNDGAYKEPTDVYKYMPTATEIFVEKDDITYDYKTGKITRSVVWNYN